MLHSMGELVQSLRRNLLLFNLSLIALCAVLLVISVIGGVIPLKKIGKMFGVWGALCGGICFCYYLSKTAYVNLRARKHKIPQYVESALKRIVRTLFLIHRHMGIAMIYFVAIHTAVLVYLSNSWYTSRMLTGAVLIVLMAVLSFSGMLINAGKKWRSCHSYAARLFIVLCFIHIYVKIRF